MMTIIYCLLFFILPQLSGASQVSPGSDVKKGSSSSLQSNCVTHCSTCLLLYGFPLSWLDDYNLSLFYLLLIL
jgi:hypothetical protein